MFAFAIVLGAIWMIGVFVFWCDVTAWGSNSSTAKEATKELAAAESKRAALIEQLNPRVIS
jgi:hypothetical protein